MRSVDLPVDWYVSSFADGYDALFWEEGGEERAQLAMDMLRPGRDDRILDLACGSGRRSLELSRHGFQVVGIDIRGTLLEMGGCTAASDDLCAYFHEADPRSMGFYREFDVVLSLGAGAFGHFEVEEEDQRAFAAAARALRPGGRLLVQMPNVIHVEAGLPERTEVATGDVTQVIEQRWNEATRRLEGTRLSIVDGELAGDGSPEPFERRLYSVEELAETFDSLELRLNDVFDEDGDPCAPSEEQRDIYVEARW